MISITLHVWILKAAFCVFVTMEPGWYKMETTLDVLLSEVEKLCGIFLCGLRL